MVLQSLSYSQLSFDVVVDVVVVVTVVVVAVVVVAVIVAVASRAIIYDDLRLLLKGLGQLNKVSEVCWFCHLLPFAVVTHVGGGVLTAGCCCCSLLLFFVVVAVFVVLGSHCTEKVSKLPMVKLQL